MEAITAPVVCSLFTFQRGPACPATMTCVDTELDVGQSISHGARFQLPFMLQRCRAPFSRSWDPLFLLPHAHFDHQRRHVIVLDRISDLCRKILLRPPAPQHSRPWLYEHFDRPLFFKCSGRGVCTSIICTIFKNSSLFPVLCVDSYTTAPSTS
jgi:hypothetical protein